MDWTNRADVQMLMDNVDEIKRYLVEYKKQLGQPIPSNKEELA
jgi:hypothetical protein